MEVFASIEIARDHYDILPPMVGEQIFVDGPEGGYFTYDGTEWSQDDGPDRTAS
jgi:hypothetical protein